MMERIFHRWEEWECYPAGFYETTAPNGLQSAEAIEAYAEFLRDSSRFERALERVITEWTNSCEHYLTNVNMNRIAWLGQAAMCIETRVPSCFRGGFNRLSEDEKFRANALALKWLNVWLTQRGEDPLPDLQAAASKTEMDLY